MPLTRMRELALIIVDKTADIDSKLESAGLPEPSFHPQSPSMLQENMAESRRSLLEATEELHALMLGPVELVTSHSDVHLESNPTARRRHADMILQLQQHEIFIILQAIYRFNLANSFPDKKNEATFEEISQRSGLPVSYLRRIIRYAITFRIFCEPRKGVIAHTAASMYLATNPPLREWIGMVSEEMWPAASKACSLFSFSQDTWLNYL